MNETKKKAQQTWFPETVGWETYHYQLAEQEKLVELIGNIVKHGSPRDLI